MKSSTFDEPGLVHSYVPLHDRCKKMFSDMQSGRSVVVRIAKRKKQFYFYDSSAAMLWKPN